MYPFYYWYYPGWSAPGLAVNPSATTGANYSPAPSTQPAVGSAQNAAYRQPQLYRVLVPGLNGPVVMDVVK